MDRKFEEVNPLAEEAKYVGYYLFDLINKGETFHGITVSRFIIKAYHKFLWLQRLHFIFLFEYLQRHCTYSPAYAK